MSRPGQVRLWVGPHERVQPDQVLLSVESEDLADRLTEAEPSLQEEHAALEVARQRLGRSQQRLRNAEDQLHQAQRRLDAHLDDMRAIQLGIGIPRTRRFQEERGGVYFCCSFFWVSISVVFALDSLEGRSPQRCLRNVTGFSLSVKPLKSR